LLTQKEVSFFEPILHRPFAYKKDENFKKFLLTKLINADYAVLKSPAFSVHSQQIFDTNLRDLCTKTCDIDKTLIWSTNLNDPKNDEEIVRLRRNSKFLYAQTKMPQIPPRFTLGTANDSIEQQKLTYSNSFTSNVHYNFLATTNNSKLAIISIKYNIDDVVQCIIR
jgi:wyosine [tRNA(Phe)-imidazoG37] synthetase (radical SAM superfamily)